MNPESTAEQRQAIDDQRQTSAQFLLFFFLFFFLIVASSFLRTVRTAGHGRRHRGGCCRQQRATTEQRRVSRGLAADVRELAQEHENLSHSAGYETSARKEELVGRLSVALQRRAVRVQNAPSSRPFFRLFLFFIFFTIGPNETAGKRLIEAQFANHVRERKKKNLILVKS